MHTALPALTNAPGERGPVVVERDASPEPPPQADAANGTSRSKGRSRRTPRGYRREVEAVLGDRGRDLARLRPASLPLLREDERPVGEHVELPRFALLHLGVVSRLRELGHETRGPFVVAASDGAVEDANGRHDRTLAVR